MKKVLLLICMFFLLTGCTKEEKKDTVLQENAYNLSAADGKSIILTLPREYVFEQKKEKESVLKAYYQNSSTKPLNIYYFKESDGYSVKDIERKMYGFIEEYRELVQTNHGKILDTVDLSKIKSGYMTGKYVEVMYTLHGNISYCGEFYLQSDGYVMHGTVRLDGDDKEHLQIAELVEKLLPK